MKVEVIESTDDPEEVICKAARNDYEDRYLGEHTFEEIMTPISESDSVPEELEDSHDTELGRKKIHLIEETLLKHGHFGPFEHPHITFAVKGVSRSLMAQITRHRHVTFDIQSMRYVGFDDANPEPGEAVVQIPGLDDPGITGRNAEFSEANKDLSDEEVLEQRRKIYEKSIKESFQSYQDLLDLGLPPQDSRMVLPIGTKVNMVFTLNARMLMHVADMRASGEAQWEVRQMTEDVLDLAEEWCPITFNYYNREMKGRKNRLSP